MPHRPANRNNIAKSFGRQAFAMGIARDCDTDTKFIKWLDTAKDNSERLTFKVMWYNGYDSLFKPRRKNKG